jgi:hypothetical protein
MAGIRILLVGRVVKKIKKARAAAVLLIVKLSNITKPIRLKHTRKNMEKFFV